MAECTLHDQKYLYYFCLPLTWRLILFVDDYNHRVTADRVLISFSSPNTHCKSIEIMNDSSDSHKYRRNTFHGLFIQKQRFRSRRRQLILNKSHLCLGDLSERQRRSYLGYCFPPGTHKWVEIVHARWRCCFMKLTLPIWSCEQIKTNRIYCKHFLNHVLGGQKKLSTPHVYSALECFCKVDPLLKRRC